MRKNGCRVHIKLSMNKGSTALGHVRIQKVLLEGSNSDNVFLVDEGK